MPAAIAWSLAACTTSTTTDTDTDTDTDVDAGTTPTDGGDPDCVEIPTDCSSPTELKNQDIKGGKTLAAGTCYTVNENLSLSDGKLVAEDGVVLKFGIDRSLRVTSGGQLKLNGTCEHKVRFMSQDPGAYWQGVQMDGSQGSDNVWSYAVFENGGGKKWSGAASSDAAVYLSGSTSLKSDHVTISKSKAHGLIAGGEADFTFDNSTFSGNDTPGYLHPQVADRIPDNVVLDGNTNDYFRVVFGNTDKVEGEHRWGPHRFHIEDRFFVAGDLTLAPGATLEFAQNASMIVNVGATLTAKGAADAPVTFAGQADTKGFWQGIEIKSGGTGTPATIGATFDHAVISEAGGKNWNGGAESKAALFLNDTSAAQITNTTFKNGGRYGVWASSVARLPGFSKNTFDGNERVMYLHPDRVGELDTESTFTANTENVIHVGFGNTDRVSTAATWRDPGVPFSINDRFFVGAAWTIDAGVTLLFPQNQGVIVAKDTGSITANGTAAKPIVMKGQNEVATGYWQGIHIQSNSPANKLTFTTVSHAGVKGWNGGAQSDAAIFVDDDTQIALSDVTLGPGGGYGVHLAGSGSMISCGGVTFTGLVKGSVYDNPAASVLPGCL